jgi:hypothetical protein
MPRGTPFLCPPHNQEIFTMFRVSDRWFPVSCGAGPPLDAVKSPPRSKGGNNPGSYLRPWGQFRPLIFISVKSRSGIVTPDSGTLDVIRKGSLMVRDGLSICLSLAIQGGRRFLRDYRSGPGSAVKSLGQTVVNCGDVATRSRPQRAPLWPSLTTGLWVGRD